MAQREKTSNQSKEIYLPIVRSCHVKKNKTKPPSVIRGKVQISFPDCQVLPRKKKKTKRNLHPPSAILRLNLSFRFFPTLPYLSDLGSGCPSLRTWKVKGPTPSGAILTESVSPKSTLLSPIGFEKYGGPETRMGHWT